MAANNGDDARMKEGGQPPVAAPQGNGSSGPKAGAYGFGVGMDGC